MLRWAIQQTGFQAASERDLVDKGGEKVDASVEHAAAHVSERIALFSLKEKGDGGRIIENL